MKLLVEMSELPFREVVEKVNLDLLFDYST